MKKRLLLNLSVVSVPFVGLITIGCKKENQNKAQQKEFDIKIKKLDHLISLFKDKTDFKQEKAFIDKNKDNSNNIQNNISQINIHIANAIQKTKQFIQNNTNENLNFLSALKLELFDDETINKINQLINNFKNNKQLFGSLDQTEISLEDLYHANNELVAFEKKLINIPIKNIHLSNLESFQNTKNSFQKIESNNFLNEQRELSLLINKVEQTLNENNTLFSNNYSKFQSITILNKIKSEKNEIKNIANNVANLKEKILLFNNGELLKQEIEKIKNSILSIHNTIKDDEYFDFFSQYRQWNKLIVNVNEASEINIENLNKLKESFNQISSLKTEFENEKQAKKVLFDDSSEQYESQKTNGNILKSLVSKLRTEFYINEKNELTNKINRYLSRLDQFSGGIILYQINDEIVSGLKSFNEYLVQLENEYNILNKKNNRYNQLQIAKNNFIQQKETILQYENTILASEISSTSNQKWTTKINKIKSNIINTINVIEEMVNNETELDSLDPIFREINIEFNQIKVLYNELLQEQEQTKLAKQTFEELKRDFNQKINKLDEIKTEINNLNSQTYHNEILGLKEQINTLKNNFVDFGISNKSYENNYEIKAFLKDNLVVNLENQLNLLKEKIANEETANPTNNNELSLSEVEDYYANNPNITKFNNQPRNKANELNTNLDYYTSILSRTFSFLWNFKKVDENKPADENLNFYTGGTFWILDYKHIENNKYKIFLGTNYHVAVNLLTPNDYKEYKQPIKNKTANQMLLSVNRAIIDPNNIDQPNVNIFLPEKFWPKTFWLASNFMNEKASIPNQDLYFADFAVVEWNIDLDELKEYYNPQLATTAEAIKKEKQRAAFIAYGIQKGIEQLEATKTRFNQNKTLNKDWNLPYANIDYFTTTYIYNNQILNYNNSINNSTNKTKWTINKINELSKELANAHLTNDKYYQARPDLIHFVGYGLRSQSSLKVDLIGTVPNNQRYAKEPIYKQFKRKIFNIDPTNHGKIVKESIKFNDQVPVQYGGWYVYYTDTETVGGMSGSLVINQEGLPIGVVFGTRSPSSMVILNDENKYVSLYNTSIVPFSLEAPLYNSLNGLSAYPYNLIDGTNKTKYENQIMSYHEKLIEVFGKEYKTAIFN
ncbi:MIP family Ig-specific serine endopeptidase [[Mycoplasma] anseris]|uniref:DUF31 domain-containing protein n=2 Tax=[Mycoplasma] anseris TaxID=92400 RepID=A0A2Z4NCR6_9BACT|nr:hypothetical protein [[Mycoplasma] anseris]AWX69349.1 hypothetical protein DP065_01085 [[Mycoplasma] anseris]